MDGKRKVIHAFTHIRGIGKRISAIICRKADVDVSKRAGELTAEEVEHIIQILHNPSQYKISNHLLNRQKDIKTGAYSQAVSNNLDAALREDLERVSVFIFICHEHAH